MNNISAFQKCSNCGACYNVCPVNAITVREDGLFYSLSVDEAKCLDCGLCQKVCPVNTPQEKQRVVRAYAAIHNDAQVVRSSSSGGVFRAIADRVIASGGVVYGAAYADNFQSVKLCSSEDRTLEDLQKSKYVESLVGLSFWDVKQHLERGSTVLYCGAPCQIAGLKRFLDKEYDALITCDFSCGGMPSHKLYQEWLSYLNEKLKASVCSVDFRPKTYGWSPHAIKVQAENGRTYSRLAKEDPYLDCFIGEHISVRDYCLECEFANNHYADIILADFWKYKSISKVDNRNKGISLVLTNSGKGERVISSLSKQVALTELDMEKASYNLTVKRFGTDFLARRRSFLQECRMNGFMSAQEKRKYRLEFRLKYKLKKLLERV